MAKTLLFTGAGVAIVTPFNADGSVNYDSLRNMLEYQVENGTDAIIICGTTGEASTLTDEEQISVVKFAVDVINKRIPVIAGAGSNDTAQYSRGGAGICAACRVDIHSGKLDNVCPKRCIHGRWIFDRSNTADRTCDYRMCAFYQTSN